MVTAALWLALDRGRCTPLDAAINGLAGGRGSGPPGGDDPWLSGVAMGSPRRAPC